MHETIPSIFDGDKYIGIWDVAGQCSNVCDVLSDAMALTVAHFPLFDFTPTTLDFFRSQSICEWIICDMNSNGEAKDKKNTEFQQKTH